MFADNVIVSPDGESRRTSRRTGLAKRFLVPRRAGIAWLRGGGTIRLARSPLSRPPAPGALRFAVDALAVAVTVGGLLAVAESRLRPGEMAAVLGLLVLGNAALGGLLGAALHPAHGAASERAQQMVATAATWLGTCALVLLPLVLVGAVEPARPSLLLLALPAGALALLGSGVASARIATRWLRGGRLASRSAIVVRLDPSRTVEAARALPRLGIRVAAQLDRPPGRDDPAAARELLETVRDRVSAAPVSEILVLGSPGPALDALREVLHEIPLPVHLLPDRAIGRLFQGPMGTVGGRRTFELQRAPLRAFERALKRTIDVAGAATLLVLLSPLLVSVAILIALDSPGPVLFRQRRAGFCGRPFAILKFRSMRVAEDGDEVVQARRGDARVTRVGRWLRSTSVDELPQLLNVLRGEMSLVGPRPHALAHDKHYRRIVGRYAARYHLQPGITGWAQVNGWRGETPTPDLMERRVEHDLWYIRHWSLALDLRILLMTLGALARPQRAY